MKGDGTGVGRVTRVGGHEDAPATREESEDMPRRAVLRVERCIFASLDYVNPISQDFDNSSE